MAGVFSAIYRAGTGINNYGPCSRPNRDFSSGCPRSTQQVYSTFYPERILYLAASVRYRLHLLCPYSLSKCSLSKAKFSDTGY